MLNEGLSALSLTLTLTPTSAPPPNEGGDGAAPVFRNALSEFIYTRTYARWVPEGGRRETWAESVGRYLEFLQQERSLPKGLVPDLRHALLRMDVLPSMRALWSAGDAARRDNTMFYNCSCVPLDNLKAFAELLYILMMGCGVGFSVERQFVGNLPVVTPLEGVFVYYTVEDSTEGWAEAFYDGLCCWFKGVQVEYDFSQVREAGAPLKVKGGRASGPDPLKRLLDFAQRTVLGASGRQLTSLECHDIACMVGEIVMAGGVRRAALISFSDPDDEEMRHAKDWSRGEFPACRYMANNSGFYASRPDRAIYEREWAALKNSGSGERGFSIGNWTRRAPRKGILRSNPCHEIGLRVLPATDPWTGEGGGGQFCVSGDTPLITREGLTTIREAVNRPVHIWNGQRWSEVRPFQTGIGQKLNRVWFSDGSYLDCTDYHRFSVSNRNTRSTKNPWREMTVAEIREAGVDKRWGTEPFRISQDEGEVVEDTYTLGAAVGDGWVRKTRGDGNPNPRVYTGLWGAKDAQMPVVGVYGRERVIGNNAIAFRSVFCPDQNPEFVTALKTDAEALGVVFTWCRESILQFLAGWLDADGTQCGPGRVRLYLSKESRARTVQLLLTRCGIRSSVGILAEVGSATNLGVRTESLFYVDITDCSSIPCHRLDTSLGHTPRFKSKFQMIRSIEELPGLHATFCFEEPERHMGVFGNTLTYQCNLSAAVMRAEDTRETMAEKVRLATWVGAIQSTFTYFPYLRPGWAQTCIEDRLLGVDITGQCDNPALSNDPEAMSFFNEVARETAKQAAAHLGINEPAAITCGKPSGNSSQLVDCASGFHPRYAPYYIRRVRIANTDPLFRLAREAGVPAHKDNSFADWDDDKCPTWVVEFPVAAPKGAMTRNDETAIQQLNRYLHIMRTWCSEKGHNQSATIYVRDHEWDEVGEWVYTHFDEITGLSFLPYDGGTYKLAPYEEITEAQYHDLMKNFPALDYAMLALYEREDMGNGAQEYACVGGVCTL